jgi:hypothetical protein
MDPLLTTPILLRGISLQHNVVTIGTVIRVPKLHIKIFHATEVVVTCS